MIKKLLFVINPCSGKNSHRIKPDDILSSFDIESNGAFEMKKLLTQRSGHATELVEKYAPEFDAVVCCGGDGTFNEAINGMMRLKDKKPLVYLPMGSTNDLANTLGIPKDIPTVTKLILDNSVKHYDVGKFNGSYFTYVASFGVGTAISYSTPQWMKNHLGHSAYILNGFILKAIPQLKDLRSYHMKIEYDDEVIEDDFYFGAMANTTEVAGLFKLKKSGVLLDDGKFEVILVKKFAAGKFPALLNDVTHQNYNTDLIMSFKADKLKITGEESAWTLDGEFGGAPETVDFKVIKGAVDLIAPKSDMFSE